MDILNFNTRFGKAFASKILSNILSKKLGFRVAVDLNKLHIRNDGNTLTITFSGEASAPTSEVRI